MIFIGVSLFFAILSVSTTAILIRFAQFNVVLASALPSLLIAILCLLFNHKLPNNFATEIPFIFLGCSFVGMSTANHLRFGWHVVSGAVFFGLIYNLGRLIAVGFGGKLGLIACIAVVCTIGIEHIIVKLKKSIKKEV